MSKNVEEVVVSKEEMNAIIEQQKLVMPVNVSDRVMNTLLSKSENGKIAFPKDYAIGNALNAGYIKMQGSKGFANATPASKAEALLDMVLLGQYPGKHGYFITYGSEMTWFQKYTGRMYVVNRALGLKISAQPIYKDDEFSYEVDKGVYRNIIHKQNFNNIDSNKIIGSYAIAVTDDENETFVRAEIMTMAQIEQAWAQSTNAKKKEKFREEYARRSVYNRLTKWFAETKNIESEILNISTKNDYQHYEFEETPENPNVDVNTKDFDKATVITEEDELPQNPKPSPVKEPQKKPINLFDKTTGEIVDETIDDGNPPF